MASKQRLQEIADIINHHVAAINSREQSSLSEFPVPDGSDGQSIETSASRDAIMEAADELQMLLRRPEEYLTDLVTNQVRCFQYSTASRIEN